MRVPLPPASTSTDQRLDAVIAELRAIRAVLTPAERNEPKDGETVQLREPATQQTPDEATRH